MLTYLFLFPSPLKVIALGFQCFILFSLFRMKDQEGYVVSLLLIIYMLCQKVIREGGGS